MTSQVVHTDRLREFAVAVSESLGKVGQRELPSMYLYDELGTALFEAITLLPEYGLTRAEVGGIGVFGLLLDGLGPPAVGTPVRFHRRLGSAGFGMTVHVNRSPAAAAGNIAGSSQGDGNGKRGAPARRGA